MKRFRSIHAAAGFTLIEAVIGTAVFVIVALSLYSLFTAGYRSIGMSKARLEATALANEKLEVIRNLPYASIGTTTGWPAGSIPVTQAITGQGVEHTVTTQVNYVDDPFDGTAVQSTDAYPWDYKKATLTITWEKFPAAKPVVLTTNVAPKGIETGTALGTLWVHVFNADAAPVTDATVHVTNATVSPAIDITDYTSVNGDLLVYALPPATESYHIVVTKDGYSSAQTYPTITDPANPGYNPYPDPADASVAVSAVTDVSLAIDLVSTLDISTVAQGFAQNWRVNNDAGEADQNFASVSLDANGNSYFAWRDYRDNKWTVYSQKYDSSRVKQWQNDVQITSAANQGEPTNATDANGNTYVAWNDDRNGNQDVYLQKFDSAGTDVWSGGKKIVVSAESADQIGSAVALEGTSAVYVVFQDNRSGTNQLYAIKYNPDGSIAWPAEIKISNDAASAEQTSPSVAFSSAGAMYIAWEDARNGNADIYMQKMLPDGSKAFPADIRVNTDTGTGAQVVPEIVAESGGTVYVVWQDDRNGNNDIYAQKYAPNGVKQWPEDVRINLGGLAAAQTVPSAVLDGANNLYVVWQDMRGGNNDIYAQKYDFNGTALWTADQKINTDGGSTSQEKPDVAVTADGAQIVYAWQDKRNSNYDIYAATFGGPGAIVMLPNVPLRVKGVNKIIGHDFDSSPIFKYNQLQTTDGTGHLVLSNMEWDSYIIEPEAGSGYTLNLSDPSQPVELAPNTTVPTTLNLTAP